MDNSINDILGVTGTQSAFNPVNDSSNADLFKPSSDSSLSQQLFINRFEQSLIQAPLAAAQSITERGVFSVDQTGKLTIDFLADSGSYRSEMAIFSLRGMDGFTLGSNEFIKEAASRALSSSSLGYVVINDSNEGARFIGDLGESDKNDDQYTGVKTFDFTPGDRVAMMLVPQGTIREVLNSALLDGNKLPLFSITGANPGKATQLGQILPNVFGWEDLRIDQGGDADYNDIVFQVKGAVTTQIDLGKLAASGKDWQDLPFARQIFSAVFEDKNSPDLKAGLLEDTGANKLDQVTSNPVITGTVTDDGAIRRLRAGFGDSGKTIDILSLLQDDGSFTLDRQELATLQGNELIDGDYKLILEAEDKFGKVSKSIIDLVLDTKAAITPSEIKIKDNLGIITNQKTPTLIGKAETGTTIQIFEGATRLGETIAANGRWELTTTQLTDGTKSLTVQSIDLAGNKISSTFALTVDTVLPTFNFATTNTQLNLGAKLQGSIDGNGSAIDRVSYRFGNGAEVAVPVNAQGQFDVAFDFSGLSGTQNLVLTAVDVAGNVTITTSVVTINTDNTLPRAVLTSQASTAANYLELAFDKPVTDESFAADKYSLKLTDGAQAGGDISISSIQKLSSTQVRVNLANPLAIGNYRLALAAGITDAIGNVTTASQVFDLRSAAPAVTISPADGEERISLSRDTVIRFGKKIDPTTVNNDSFYLIANGERVAGRIKVSSTEEFATFFYDAPLPAATAIRVVVDGNKIIGRDGLAVDGDGNGTPGGMATGDFSTLPITPIPGTEVWGYVYDSYNKNPDGSNIPLKNVTIRLDSLPTVTATTDEQGYFILKNLPASDFFVYIDGAKAVGLPTVSQYAGLGKALHSVPGQSTQLFANGQTFNIYLPPMAASDIQTLSTDTDTNVGFGSAAQAFLQQRFPNIDADLWKQVQVTFKAGSAQDDAGVAATQATIIPVDPSRLPAPLPAGADPKLVISIQAGGANGFNREAQGGSTSFDVPAPLQFPNLDGLKPGDKSLFWSFDHDAGKWVIIGTGTVSLDGKMIVSDPGIGVLAPGWHFTQPGNCGGSGGAPPAPANPGDVMFDFNEAIPLVTGESGSFFKKEWIAPAKLPNSPPSPAPTNGCSANPRQPNPTNNQPYLKVDIKIEGALADFMKQQSGTTEPLTGSSFTLQAGSNEKRSLEAIAKSYVEMASILGGTNSAPLSQLNENLLLGSKIIITEEAGKADGSKQTDRTTYYLYRFIDATDANHNDKSIEFEDTVVNNTRSKTINLKVGSDTPQITTSNGFTVVGSTVQFTPTVAGQNQAGTLTIKTPTGKDVGTLTLLGDGEAKQKWFVDINSAGSGSFLNSIQNSFDTVMTVSEKLLFGVFDGNGNLNFDPAKALSFINDVITEAETLLSPFSAGLERVSSSSPGTVSFDDWYWDSNDTNNLEALGTAFVIDNKNGQFSTDDINNNRTVYSNSEQNFRLSEALNENYNGNVDIYVDRYFTIGSVPDPNPPYLVGTGEWTRQQLVNSFGKTISHELGHTLGLNHTNSFNLNDVLAQGFVTGARRNFSTTANSFKIGLGLPWTRVEGQQAIQYYSTYIANGGGDAALRNLDPDSPTLTPINDGLLWLLENGSKNFVDKIDFGKVNLDNTVSTLSFDLTNLGDQVANISNVSLLGNTGQFSLNGLTSNFVLSPGANKIINISFDPSVVGQSKTSLVINSDALQKTIEIPLTGFGQSLNASLSFNTPNNNLGGVSVSGDRIAQSNLATITNNGDQPLIISDIKLVENTSSFSLLGLATDLTTKPISLNTGESWSFGIGFHPGKVELEKATLEITSNDPKSSITRFSFVGTGLDKVVYPQWGNDFITIELPNLPNSPTIHVQTDAKGNFQTVLPPEQYYHLVAFDPVTSLVSHSYGYTSKSGQGIDLTASLVFNASTAADTDGDGLPDDIEFAVGTATNKIDTDGDGLSDFAEIQQGIDPLGGRGFPTGIIASLPLKGEANAVVVEGSITNPQNQTAYVATGSYGLAVVNASKFNSPIVLGQLDLLGDATDIAVDSKRNIAAVAANDGGLHLVNVADGMLPILNQTIKLAANQVEVADGIAYATVNNTLHVIDLSSGQELQILTLPGFGTVTGLAREGTKLYAYVSGSDTFLIVDIAEEGAAKLLGQLNVNIASLDVGVSAGNGVAYLAGSGLSTIDVSDPLNPKLISGADTFFTARNVALNGSGLALVSAEDQGVGVYSINDLQKTDNVLTVVNTPGFTYGAAIASGIAFVADGDDGLQVINYLPFDNKGKSPTININTAAIDLDPNTNGIQVKEGSVIPLRVDIRDDVQIRNVELLVNGLVITNDVSFPWDLSVITPNISLGKNTVDIQVRTTDTGGNNAISNLLTLNLVADTTAPIVLGTTPTEDGRTKSVPSITIKFNEAIDPTKLNIAGITLTNLGPNGILGGGDDVITSVSSLQTRNFNQTLVIQPTTELLVGNYQLKVDSQIIADQAGNALANPVTINFAKRPFSIIPVFLDTPIVGKLTQAGDDEIYVFAGTAGQNIALQNTAPSKERNIFAEITSPSGKYLGEYYFNSTSELSLGLSESGDYRITIKSSNNAIGDYNFKLVKQVIITGGLA
jgi:hypothetical protein